MPCRSSRRSRRYPRLPCAQKVVRYDASGLPHITLVHEGASRPMNCGVKYTVFLAVGDTTNDLPAVTCCSPKDDRARRTQPVNWPPQQFRAIQQPLSGSPARRQDRTTRGVSWNGSWRQDIPAYPLPAPHLSAYAHAQFSSARSATLPAHTGQINSAPAANSQTGFTHASGHLQAPRTSRTTVKQRREQA